MWYQVSGIVMLATLGLLALPFRRARALVLQAILWLVVSCIACGIVLAGIGFLSPTNVPNLVQEYVEPIRDTIESIDSPLLQPGWSWLIIGAVVAVVGLVTTELIRFVWQVGHLTAKVVELSGVNAQVQTIQDALSELDASISKVRRALSPEQESESETASSTPAVEPPPVATNGSSTGPRKRTLLEIVQQK